MLEQPGLHRAADAAMIERLRRHVEAYYLEWEVPDLAPWTVYNTLAAEPRRRGSPASGGQV